MLFYDANLSYGVPINVEEKPCLPCATLNELEAALKRAGAAGGLVRTEAADVAGAVTGNALLAAALADAPAGLYGMYTLRPGYTREIPCPDALPAVMKKGRFAALRLSPRAHQYLMKPEIMADYFEMATERKIPVVLDTACGLAISEAFDIMEAFPKMTAILAIANSWPSDRYTRPFLARFPNLRMDLSYMFNAMGLEALTREYGAARFLYGSRFPAMYMGGMMLMLRHAGIPEEDKRLIAGENLLSMLREARI